MKVDLEKLNQLVESKYLSRKAHKSGDLWIYNYSPKCQYEPYWTEETKMCRGLIVDSEGVIKARPFNKFFNLSEHTEALPKEKFKVYEKFDGSLGILYWVNDEPFIATRGSFDSEQAKKGTEMLKQYDLSNIDKNKTYLFEIIYPDNRIVVDYGAREELVLLAVKDTATGKDEDLANYCGNFPFVSQVKVDNIEDLKKLQEGNKEGFVLVWPCGFRLKFKFDEYVRLHRLVTGVTARSIWDLLRNGEPIDEMLDSVPDEFYKWVKAKKRELENDFLNILNSSKMFIAVHELSKLSRKEAAALVMSKKKELSSYIFKLLDGKDPSEQIWKDLKPKHEIPFKQEL